MPQTINNMSVTWADAGITFTGIKLNVTDTASNAASLLFDLQVGGSSVFRVAKTGLINAAGMTLTGGMSIGSASNVNWNADVVLFRDAAGTLAQRNGTNAQTFRVYNTYTDGSNYERAKFEWTTNVLKIGTEQAGTGTARALELQTAGVTRLTLSADNTIATFSVTNLSIGTQLRMSAGSRLTDRSNGVLTVSSSSESDFGRLQFGGTTSAFPSLKRNSAVLQARLADDSDFTNLQGKLQTHANAVAETPTATHTLTVYDAAGTGYRILAVAV